MQTDKGGGGLYDLSKDIGEKHDVSEQEPEKLALVKQKFDAWYRETMIEAEPRGPFKDF